MATEQKVRALCAEITAPDAARTEALLAQLDPGLGRLRELAAQLAAAQRTATPTAKIKGLALFARDYPDSSAVSEIVRAQLCTDNAMQQLSRQHDVKLAVVDIGLATDFSQSDLGKQILRQRWQAKGLSPAETVWESLHAGIRTAYLMKGKGTDLFGVHGFGQAKTPLATTGELAASGAWEIGAMAGFILAAANLQTPVVLSGTGGLSAARIALSLSPHVRDYLILAQSSAPGEPGLTPLLNLKLPDALAIITALGLCESAARLCLTDPFPPCT